MIANYLKVAFRNLLRHKLYTLINVLGLAIGIAFCILIMLFIRHEYSFDNFQANGNRIYRVDTIRKLPNGETQLDAFQPMPLIPALKAEYPEVKHGTRMSTGGVIVRYGEKVFSETVMFTDPDVFSMFTFTFLSGNPDKALLSPDGIVLNQTMAGKYFGDEPALGKRLTVTIRGEAQDFIVTGVFADVPDNSTLELTFITPITQHQMYERGKERWTTANGSAFIQLTGTADPGTVDQKFGPFVRKYFGPAIDRNRKDDELSKDADAFRLTLEPLKDVHFDTKARWSPERRSDPLYSYILAGLGLFVLLIACINFTTLAIGRSASRAREVGVRKVLGAVRMQLMKQFWGEAFLLCAIALVAGIVLSEIALPSFNAVTHKHLGLNFFADGWLVIGLAGVLVLVGLAAGTYPAVFLSRFEPVEVLKGKLRIHGRIALTRVLVVIQFGLSIFLIIASVVMSGQLSYILHKDLGYNAEQVVVLQLHSGPKSPGDVIVDRLRAKLANDPHFVTVSGTNGAFTHGYDINSFKHRGVNRTAYVYRVDEYFLSTLGIKLKEGRNFNPQAPGEKKAAVFVNEALVREFGWAEPVLGTRLEGWDSTPGGPIVIGVVRDFNFASLKDNVDPAVFFMDPDWPMDQAVIRISPDNIAETMTRLHTVWSEIAPEKPFEATFLDEDVQKQYEVETRWEAIVGSATAFAIALACLGLFGLATLTVTNRTKEIGVRKVLGASVPGLLVLLSKEFALLVLVANAIAWPIAYYVSNRWLDSYAYRMHLGPSIFLFAGGLALAIALLTVSVQAIKSALSNPVDALRYE